MHNPWTLHNAFFLFFYWETYREYLSCNTFYTFFFLLFICTDTGLEQRREQYLLFAGCRNEEGKAHHCSAPSLQSAPWFLLLLWECYTFSTQEWLILHQEFWPSKKLYIVKCKSCFWVVITKHLQRCLDLTSEKESVPIE